MLLCLTVWDLCKDACDFKKIQANSRNGHCSKFSSNNQSCNGFSGSIEYRYNGDQELERDDVMKPRQENVKRRHQRIDIDSGFGFRSRGVCCFACEPKFQPCKGFQCEKLNNIGRIKDEEQEGSEEEKEFNEDEGDYIIKLRKELEKDRKLRALAEMELEKERRTSSSAANEAIAKILLHQSEKGLIEREARQYHEMAKQ